MTSGEFSSIAISDIYVGERIRKKKRSDYDRLVRSIARRGLIHPIILDREHALIAGEGRLTACRELGWDRIPFQYSDDIDSRTKRLIELEENNAREDLSWEEQHQNYMEMIAELKKEKPEITLAELCEELNLAKQTISMHTIYDGQKNNPIVRQAAINGGLTTAYKAAVRINEREFSDKLMNIVHPMDNVHSPIQTTSFLDWAPTYSGPKFNLIHCDFPYGLNEHIANRQGSSIPVAFDDSPEIYWQLFKCLAVNLDNFCADSAHLIFWFAPKFYCETWEMLKLLDGFKFDEHPLIWHKDKGIAPDTERRPRRLYEMAFFGWRNDRKIIRVKDNIINAPLERERHPHEKSQRALEHFFEMCVDANTRLFDPTCGSGSALRAARALGAKTVFGLELNEEYAEVARRALS